MPSFGVKISDIGVPNHGGEYTYTPLPVPEAVNPDDTNMKNPDNSDAINPGGS